MMLNTEEWCSPAQAHLLMGTTRQRVDQLTEHGQLECVRPWGPSRVLISLRSIDRYRDESRVRVHPISVPALQRWADEVLGRRLSADDLLDYIEQTRPEWTPEGRAHWVERFV